MKITTAEFIVSSTSYKNCPNGPYPEYAFIGRSNVGKSSLINMLTNRKNLAKTSSKPGKTQLINHFIINKNWYLVDLPGYGWAKVSKSTKKQWLPMIRDYIVHRQNLCCLFILIDSRIEPQTIDLEFIKWAGENSIPITLIMTKCDKQSRSRNAKNQAVLERHLRKTWEKLPLIIKTSSVNREGREEIIKLIEEVNKGFN